jgi:G:T-mismatch repair DNA endonuclease (very short patch repair protein)
VGWRVVRVWEHEFKSLEKVVAKLARSGVTARG